jgi:hypothetical protein
VRFTASGVSEAIRVLVEEGARVSMSYEEYWERGGRTLMAAYAASALRFGPTEAKGRLVAAELKRLDRELMASEDDLPL